MPYACAPLLCRVPLFPHQDVRGDGAEQEVEVEWDSGQKEWASLASLGRLEWLGEDEAADLVANLKELRQESVE
eukprot:4027810-Amphidinium_carterae.1